MKLLLLLFKGLGSTENHTLSMCRFLLFIIRGRNDPSWSKT